MTTNPTRTRVLLLIEDNPGDAELVAELLAQEDDKEQFQLVHVPRLTDAVEQLRLLAVDVVLLDLHLPDGSGVDSVRAVRDVAWKVPIVVLTGSDDEKLALSCIDAGAQDYLAKSEVRARNLRRAIGYAITRIREAQVRELEAALERYRALSSAGRGTSVTAAMAGSGAVALRHPQAFAELTDAYFQLLEGYLSELTDRLAPPRQPMEVLITRVGDVGGGPRDLLDIHLAAFDRAIAQNESARAHSIVFEGRLLALEMMGLLVDYYRVGQRRWLSGESP